MVSRDMGSALIAKKKALETPRYSSPPRPVTGSYGRLSTVNSVADTRYMRNQKFQLLGREKKPPSQYRADFDFWSNCEFRTSRRVTHASVTQMHDFIEAEIEARQAHIRRYDPLPQLFFAIPNVLLSRRFHTDHVYHKCIQHNYFLSLPAECHFSISAASNCLLGAYGKPSELYGRWHMAG